MSTIAPITPENSEASTVIPATVNDDAWREHRRAAVLEFLKNVVVIDNEPVVDQKGQEAVEIDNPPPSTGEDQEEERKFKRVERPVLMDEDVGESHPLDIRLVSDAFAEKGIACAFVLPDDRDVAERAEDRIRERILNAARCADLVVIDWHLRGSDPTLTLEILKEIAKRDIAEKGRMRLICIYTGQNLAGAGTAKGILQGAIDSLAEGGVTVAPVAGVTNAAKSVDCLLIVASKKELPPSGLPMALVDAFTHLADGLLPSFALAAVGAIRKNVHHMVTRFSGSLDAAYVANRMITDPPGDVAELIRELFVSECDSAIGLERVADRFLDVEEILTWMQIRGVPLTKKYYDYRKNSGGKEEKITVNLDRDFLEALVRFGVSDADMNLDSSGRKQPFKEDRRCLVSKALAASEQQAVEAEQDFARLVSLRREAFGSTKISDDAGWRPSLTTGTMVKAVGKTHLGSSYFICLTPACDTLRLGGKERFVFVGNVADGKRVNFVVADEDKKIAKLYFPHDRPNLITLEFDPDMGTKRVLADRADDGNKVRYQFTDSTGGKLLWMGEVRYARATSDVAKVVGNWMRIGVNDSEFLRLAARGRAKF